MGGTSTDVSLIQDGEPLISRQTSLGYYPIKIPSVEVHSVGAGGGSIVHVPMTGALRVGPESAGAAPGPACYGRGGTEPTNCDANVVIGRLSDCMNKNPGKSHWMEVRKAQVEVAEKDPRGAWVDTDDLNGPKDGLHYNKEGYAELGKRFAEKAVELVKKGE